MNLNKCLAWAGLLALIGFTLAGCGRSGAGPDAQAFAKAAPEIKADWDAAVAADKANDYFTASVSYARVVQQESKLTPKQFEAALTASRELSARLSAAAEKGDAAAREALAKLMRSQGQR